VHVTISGKIEINHVVNSLDLICIIKLLILIWFGKMRFTIYKMNANIMFNNVYFVDYYNNNVVT
jgi:hypothetical protein